MHEEERHQRGFDARNGEGDSRVKSAEIDERRFISSKGKNEQHDPNTEIQFQWRRF